MTRKKRGFVPLFSVFQSEQSILAAIIVVIALILVSMFPILLILLIPILITAGVIGIIGLLAILAGLVDTNKEALEYQTVEHTELTSGGVTRDHNQPAFAEEPPVREGDQ